MGILLAVLFVDMALAVVINFYVNGRPEPLPLRSLRSQACIR
jgi:hypothetical protein